MHTYLYLHQNPAARAEEIDRQISHFGISAFDRISPSEEGASIGISEIRTFIKRLTLAPVEGTHVAGFIVNAELLTQEAQQALLKTLEEPPAHAYIFLGAANDLQLLPTIISRCIVMPGAAPALEIPVEKLTAMHRFIEEILSATPGKKIHLIASAGKTKDEIDAWINTALQCLHADLTVAGSTPENLGAAAKKTRLIHRLFEAKKYLVGNVNPLLLLEHAVQ